LYLNVGPIVVSRGADGLLICRFERAGVARFLAQALYSVHHVLLLRQESIAEI
jgi:hypothetical protein